jgi:hypothetical protein
MTDEEYEGVLKQYLLARMSEYETAADFVRATGIAAGTLSDVKEGRRNASMKQLLRISRCIGPPMHEVLEDLAVLAEKLYVPSQENVVIVDRSGKRESIAMTPELATMIDRMKRAGIRRKIAEEDERPARDDGPTPESPAPSAASRRRRNPRRKR